MTGRVTELKTLLQDKERALEDVTIERKELMLRNDELGATCQSLEKRLLQQTTTSEDAKNKLQQIISAREAEVSLITVDNRLFKSALSNMGPITCFQMVHPSLISFSKNEVKDRVTCIGIHS